MTLKPNFKTVLLIILLYQNLICKVNLSKIHLIIKRLPDDINPESNAI